MSFPLPGINRLILPALLFSLALNCGKKGERPVLVAEVGKDEITLEAVTELFSQRASSIKTPEEELAEKQKLLDFLIERQLLSQEGYRQKLDQDSLIRAYLARESPLFLIDQLYLREVREKAKLSEAELGRLYQALKYERCLKQLFTARKEEADRLLARLERGENFDSLAVELARTSKYRGREGDIGCLSWSRQPSPVLFEQILKMKKGDRIGPLEAPEGWTLLYCYDIRPTQPPSLESIRPSFQKLLEAEREGKQSQQFLLAVRTEFNYRVVDSTARLANQKQQELSKIETPGLPTRFSVRIRTEELSRFERGLPLVSFDGGGYTMGQYLEAMQSYLPGKRPVLDSSEATRDFLFQFVFQEIMAGAAQKKGLDRGPNYLKMVREEVEIQMARRVANQVLAAVTIDPAAVKKYFDSNSEEFALSAAFHLYEINDSSEAGLRQLKPRIKNKPEFLKSASKLTARQTLKATSGDLGWVEKYQFPELFEAASAMKTGQVAGPVKLSDGTFSLVYLDGQRAARKQKFEEVKDGLSGKLAAAAQETALKTWADRQRQKTKITVHSDVLKNSIDRRRYVKL